MLLNYLTRRRAAGHPMLLEFLDFFHEWQTPAAFEKRFRQHDPALLRDVLEELSANSFLDRSGEGDRQESPIAAWEPWSPEAALFHFGTKDVRFSDPDEADRLLVEKQRAGGAPRPLKSISGRRLRLPFSHPKGSLEQVLTRRRTWRRFGADPVPHLELARLLQLTWGVQKWAKVPGYGRVPLKTSPSGGARHSLEVYLAAIRVDGLKPGIYHYAPDTHQLVVVRPSATRDDIVRYLPQQAWYADACALMFMTSVVSRVQWRYPYARAYRAILLEAGHFCQTFCLLATARKLAPFCTVALADSAIEQDIGIDGINETVIYACGVGTRPRGVRWAPWPQTRQTPKLLPPSAAKNRRPAR